MLHRKKPELVINNDINFKVCCWLKSVRAIWNGNSEAIGTDNGTYKTKMQMYFLILVSCFPTNFFKNVLLTELVHMVCRNYHICFTEQEKFFIKRQSKLIFITFYYVKVKTTNFITSTSTRCTLLQSF